MSRRAAGWAGPGWPVAPAIQIAPAARALLEPVLADRIVAVEPLAWGFSTPTARLALAGGGRVVVQRRAAAAAARIELATRILTSAGIAVPGLRAVVGRGRLRWLVHDAIEGRPGPECLAGPDGPALARSMGGLLVRLRSLSAPEVPLDRPWAGPAELVAGARAWISALPPDRRATVSGSLERIVSGGAWRPVLVHGDFVPANAILGTDCGATLLDLGDIARRHPLVDPAWWELVVRHHHPAVAGLAAELQAVGGASFGGDGPSVGARSASADVAVVRAAQLSAAAPPQDQDHQLSLLGTAIEWAASTSDEDLPTPPPRASRA